MAISRDAINRQIAAEILVIADFVKGTPEQKIKWGKRIVGALLKTKGSNLDKLKVGTRNFAIRQAVGLIDTVTGQQSNYPKTSGTQVSRPDPQTQYTKVNVNSTAKNKENFTDSKYQTKDQCISDMTSKSGVSQSDAEEHCSEIFGDSDTERSGKSRSASLQIPAYITTNPFMKEEWLEAEADRRIRQAKNDIGLPEQDTPAWIKTKLFMDGKYVPKSENVNVKSAKTYDKFAAYKTYMWQFSDGYRNEILMNNEARDKKIHSANIQNDGTPAWLKVRQHTLSRLGQND